MTDAPPCVEIHEIDAQICRLPSGLSVTVPGACHIIVRDLGDGRIIWYVPSQDTDCPLTPETQGVVRMPVKGEET